MLEQLFGSRTRVKLLRLFLQNPHKAYFVRELTREISEQINSVRREINNLIQIGLISEVKNKVKTDKKELKKFYQVNVDFSLYPELKSLIIKSRMVLEKSIMRSVSALGSIQYLAFCGMFSDDPSAPTDILVVGRVNRKKLTALLKKMAYGLEKEINYTVMTKEEYLYRKDITDMFLYSILDGKKIEIVNKIDKIDE